MQFSNQFYLNIMKKLLTCIALLSLSFSTAFAQQRAHNWTLVITPDSHKTYLDSVATAWKMNGITLTFPTLKYDANGHLVKVKGSVTVEVSGRKNVNGTFSSENLKSIKIIVTDKPGIDISGQ